MVGPTTIVDQLRWKLGENALKLQHTEDGIQTCWIARQNAHDALRFVMAETSTSASKCLLRAVSRPLIRLPTFGRQRIGTNGKCGTCLGSGSTAILIWNAF
jgi:hypothetical protein